MITDGMRLIMHDPRGLSVASIYMTAIEAHDVAALKRMMHPKVELTHANYPPVSGRTEAVDMIEGYLDIVDGVEFEIRTLFGEDGFIAIEKVNIAESSRGGLARIRVVTILEIDDDGLVTSIRIYADTADLFQRLQVANVAK